MKRNGSSMLPLILPNDKPILKKIKNYKTNDIVVFKKKNRLIAHRLIYIFPDRKTFITKGDNNLKSDGKITKNQIFGKVISVKRNGVSIDIKHLYLMQSTNYSKEVSVVSKNLEKKGIKNIILKGLPIYLKYLKDIPKKYYCDIDILIKKKNLKTAKNTLMKNGFEPTEESVLQIGFAKTTTPFPIIIDLHLEPAIAFTKIDFLNKMIPNRHKYNDYLFKNTKQINLSGNKYNLLDTENQIVYLFLHFFHHGFKSINRLELINEIIKKTKPDWKKIEKIIDGFEFVNFVLPGIYMLEKYYQTPIPTDFILHLYPKKSIVVYSKIFSNTISPFNLSKTNIERLKRFLLLMVLSPLNFFEKLKILLSKETFAYLEKIIKSFFFRRSR